MFGSTGLTTVSPNSVNSSVIINYLNGRNYDYPPQCDNGVCGEYATCIEPGNYCKCYMYYEWKNDRDCEICPGEGELCNGCCRYGFVCSHGFCECDPSVSTCIYSSGVFVTASQIALSAALIMGIAALAMVIYRLCTRPKYLSARHRAALARARGGESGLDNEIGHNFASDIRASLSSMQIRVINRLRDRPPAYDGTNLANANAATSSAAPALNGTAVVSSISNNTNSNADVALQRNITEAPPPYINTENQIELELHRPPPYTEVVICPAGYLNQSYVTTETQSELNAGSQSNLEVFPSITISMGDNVTTIHKERNANVVSDAMTTETKTNMDDKKTSLNDRDNNNNESNSSNNNISYNNNNSNNNNNNNDNSSNI